MTPWDDLPEYEAARLASLSFEEMIAALLELAPKASSGDLAEATGATKSACKRARDAWKASRGAVAQAEFVPKLPPRAHILQNLGSSLELKNATETERWVRALVALERAGNTDPEKPTTEDWERLDDREAGILIALVHKLNGERLTAEDERWLRPA